MPAPAEPGRATPARPADAAPDRAAPAPRERQQPSPQAMLCAAQLLAQDVAPGTAATLAGLYPSTLRELRRDGDFEALVEECREVEALPKAEQDERLQRLTRRALERALADGRVGAIPAALRLLGLIPTRLSPGGKGDSTPRPRDPAPAPANDDTAPDLAPELAAAEARWGMVPDGEGGWLGRDGRPAMPDRDIEVVATERGPARMMDLTEFQFEAGAELVMALDGPPDEVARFNRSAYPAGGGLQWDPVTRTLWLWEGPDPAQASAPPAPQEEEPAPEPAPEPPPPPPAQATPAPPAPTSPPAARPTPPPRPAPVAARERPPGPPPRTAKAEFGLSPEAGIYLKRAGPARRS